VLVTIIVYCEWRFFLACYVCSRIALDYKLSDDDDSVYIELLEEEYPHYDYEVSLVSPVNPYLMKLMLDFAHAFRRQPGQASIMENVTFSRL